MECGFLPRALWTSDSKPHGPAAPEFLTSVQLTRDLPAGVCFGPCILHNTFYDTIAFIALKSCDERSKSYVFRVDPEAMRSSPLLVPWLRLVQAARDAREQNAEAYLRGGQLYFRTVKHVRQGDELLVWYDDELSHLLGFNDITSRASADGFQCRSCDQSFQHVNPFLAHCRFLCSQVKSHVVRPHSDLKQAEVKRSHKVTDFHNIARDLEHRKPSTNEDSAFPRKQKPEEPHSLRNRKTVLLEKTNIPNHDNIRNHSNIPATDQTRLSATEGTLFKRDLSESKSSAFTEVGGTSARLTRGQDPADGGQAAERAGFDGQVRRGPLGEAGTDSGLFSLALTQRAPEEQRSAFCKPGKHSAIDPTPHPAPNLTSPPTRSEDVAEGYSAKATLGYRDALASSLLHSELASTATLGVTPAPLLTSASYPYGPEHWARGLGGAVQASPSLPLLPPSFSSLGVSVQNWCAKCNLSFRMTSDLVFHMRSHHKKEFAGDAQVRKRREDELTCPICHEYFRERHHLSRHMTSHN